MDWKTNIIAPPTCNALAQPFIAYANEPFLVTLANKGLYKRAVKDLEAAGKIELKTGDRLQVVWDDVTVTLDETVAKSICSCPSKTICKHVLMAVLIAAEYASEPLDTEAPAEPWQALKEADISSLRKQAGKKLFEEVLRLIQDGWVAEFVYGDMLEAIINTENINVYFPAQDSINGAVCKCGQQGLCKHKLIAVLSYLSTQGLLDNKTDDGPGLSLITPETQLLLQNADDFIIDIFDKGIIFCGDNEIETAIQYSIRMESAGIGNLARMFRSLSSDLEHMLNKHIGFHQVHTFSILSRLHNTLRLILENTADTQVLGQLIESTRSDYYITPIGHFTGLGAYPWQTRSGYFGITAYFFYHEKQSICTYSVSLAGYYEQTQELMNMENMKRQYVKNEHWGNGLSLSTLSQSTFVLRNFKLNRQNRLSSSIQTQCEITGKVNREIFQELLGSTSLFLMPEELNEPYHYFQKRRVDQLIILPFECIDHTHFDHTVQKLYVSIRSNEKDESVTSVIEYTPLYAQTIRYMERLGRYADKNSRYMVFLKRTDGMMPLCFVGESMTNIFFES